MRGRALKEGAWKAPQCDSAAPGAGKVYERHGGWGLEAVPHKSLTQKAKK